MADAAVVGRPDPEWGESVVAAADHRVDSSALVEFCLRHLAAFKKPKTVVAVTVLPKNVIGKVLKQQLRERLAHP